jgi:hypothetical protein
LVFLPVFADAVIQHIAARMRGSKACSPTKLDDDSIPARHGRKKLCVRSGCGLVYPRFAQVWQLPDS